MKFYDAKENCPHCGSEKTTRVIGRRYNPEKALSFAHTVRECLVVKCFGCGRFSK